MFTFVPYTSSHLEGDSKKAIRAHAMRDFRRRQRAAQQSSTASGPFTSVVATTRLGPLQRGQAQPTAVYRGVRDAAPHLRMFAFIQNCVECRLQRPQDEVAAVLATLSNAWDMSPSPLLLAARCLGAFALNESYVNLPDDLHMACKARVLPGLNTRMQSPQIAITDATIHALLDLIVFELTMISPDAQKHLRGLHILLSIRGGVGTLRGSLLSMYQIAEVAELVDAIIARRELILQADTVKYWKPTQQPTSPQVPHSHSLPLSNLFRLIHAELDDRRIHDRACSATLIQRFQYLFHSISEYADAITDPSISKMEIKSKIRPTLLRTVAEFKKVACLDPGKSYFMWQCAQACYYAAAIMYNITTEPEDPQDKVTRIDLEGMFDHFAAIEEHTIIQARYLAMWT